MTKSEAQNALKELDSIQHTLNIFKAFFNTTNETFSNELR